MNISVSDSSAKDYILLVLLALIWGMSFSLIKVGVAQIGPISLAAGRLVVAAALLFAWLRFIKQTKLDCSWPSVFCYMVVGLFGNSIPFTLIGWAETTLDSSLVAMLMGCMPLVTIVLAHWFLQDERINLRSLVGIILGFLGLIVLLGFSVMQNADINGLALFAAMLAAMCYAGTTIFVRKFVTISGLQIATGATLAAALFSVILSGLFEAPMTMPWNINALMPLILLGIFPTALASLLYYYLVRRMGATRFSQINYIIPLFGGLIGIVFLNEQSHWQMWLALVLILFGIYMVHGARLKEVDS